MIKKNNLFQLVRHTSLMVSAMCVVVLIIGNTLLYSSLVDNAEELIELVDLEEKDQENEDGEKDAKETKKLEDKVFNASITHSFLDILPTINSACIQYLQNLHHPISTPPPEVVA